MDDITCRPVDDGKSLERCFEIRHRVFVQEQSIFHVTDRDDLDRNALHIAAFYRGRIIGTVRIYKDADGIWWGGRLAVLKKYRGRAGRALVQAAVAMVKGYGTGRFCAQVLEENVNFFRNLGWRELGGSLQLYGRKHKVMAIDL